MQTHIGYIAEVDIPSYGESDGNGEVVNGLYGEIEAGQRLNDRTGIITAYKARYGTYKLAHIEDTADGVVDEYLAVEFEFPLIRAERFEILVEIGLIRHTSFKPVADLSAERRGLEDIDLGKTYIDIVYLKREVEHAHGAGNSEHHVVTDGIAVYVGFRNDFSRNGELRPVVVQRINAPAVALVSVSLSAEFFGNGYNELIGKFFLLGKRSFFTRGRIHIRGRVEIIIGKRIVEEIVDAAFAGIFEGEIVVIVYRLPAHVRERGGERLGRDRTADVGIFYDCAYKEVLFVFAYLLEKFRFCHGVEFSVAQVIRFDIVRVEGGQRSIGICHRHHYAISGRIGRRVLRQLDRYIRIVGEFARECVISVAYLLRSIYRFARRRGSTRKSGNDGVENKSRLILRVVGSTERRMRIIDHVANVAVRDAEHLGLLGIPDITVSGIDCVRYRIVADRQIVKEGRSQSELQIIVARKLVDYRRRVGFVGYSYRNVVPFGVGNVDRLLIIETESERKRIFDVIEVYRYLAELLFEGEVKYFFKYRLERGTRDDYRNGAFGELDAVEESEVPVYGYGFFFVLIAEGIVAFFFIGRVGGSFVGIYFGILCGSLGIVAAEEAFEQSAELRDEIVESGHDTAGSVAYRTAESIEQLTEIEVKEALEYVAVEFNARQSVFFERAHGHIEAQSVFLVSFGIVEAADHVQTEIFLFHVELSVSVGVDVVEAYELNHGVDRPLIECGKLDVGFYSQRHVAYYIVKRLYVERRAYCVAVLVLFVSKQRAPVQDIFLEVRRERDVESEIESPFDACFAVEIEASVVI